MSRTRSSALVLRIMAALVVCSTLAVLASGRALAAPLAAVPANSLTIAPGESGVIQVKGVSLRSGTAFPSGGVSLASQPLAPDRVRYAIFYAIDWGYADSSPQQVALATWWVQEGIWHAADHAIGERIGGAAMTAPGTPSWNPEGQNLLMALMSRKVSISAFSLTPASAGASYGTGTLTVLNTSTNPVTVYLPYGTLVSNGLSEAVVWASGVGAPNPATTTPATPSPATPPTDTPQPSPATETPSPVPPKGGGQPPAPSATSQAPATPTRQYKGLPSPQPTNTNTPLPPTQTPTPEPTATSSNTPIPPTSTPLAPQPQQVPTQEAVGANQGAGTGAVPSNPQQPRSDLPRPPAQKGTNEAITAPPVAPAPQNAPSGDAQSSAKDVPSENVAAAPPRSPAESLAGPPIPVTPSNTPSSSSGDPAPAPVATAGGSSGDGSVPLPVSTAAPDKLAPLPQATGAATAAPPAAVPTGQPPVAPLPSSTPTDPATGTGTGDAEASGGGSSDGQSGGGAGTDAEKQPVPVPTPAPAPQEQKPDESSNIVDASTGSEAAGGAGGTPSDAGAPPASNPATGGGPSNLPVWLSLASALMLLGGWSLRRIGRSAPPRPTAQD